MIDLDVLTYLKNDATLIALLEADINDSHIYPVQSPHSTVTNLAVKKHIIYNTISEGTIEENLLYKTITFMVRARAWADVNAIASRLYILLDRQDNIRQVISSVDLYFYWAKIVGGDSFYEPDMDLFTKALNVEFKYHMKNRTV